MRNELLADWPTENQVQTVEVQRTQVQALDYNTPAAHSLLTTPRESLTRALSATYARVRQLPARTLFLIVLGAYVVLTAAVVFGSPLDIIDRAAAMSDLAHHFPHATPWVLHYVMLGQRGPSSHVAFVYLVWRAIRQRSWRPLVLFVTALTMLNVTVGSVKLATGRLGPALTTHPRAVFDGGDIFPSGHTSNAVVIFGVLAMVAARASAGMDRARRLRFHDRRSEHDLPRHALGDRCARRLARWCAWFCWPCRRPTHLLERWAFRVITRRSRNGFTQHPRLGARQHGTPSLPRHELTSDMLTEDAMYR